MKVVKPIFLIGVPRSGTTIVFDDISSHPDLGWLSNYTAAAPRASWLNVIRLLCDNRYIHLRGLKKQHGKVLFGNRYLPQPDESYAFWDHYADKQFSTSYLLDKTASRETSDKIHKAISDILFWQGKHRFATKLTGPGRIGYLDSIFPDAYFIHLIRDGRSVVQSLLRVDFWKDNGGLERPFWSIDSIQSSLSTTDAKRLSPAELAAIQWRLIIETTRKEAEKINKSAERYLEVKYEDYVADPVSQIKRIYELAGLKRKDMPFHYQKKRITIKDMNRSYTQGISDIDMESVNKIMEPILDGLGYQKT